MGLDLMPMPKPKIGFDAEFNSFIARLALEEEFSDDEKARFEKNTVPAYASLGAPQVGYDPQADEWILSLRLDCGDARSREDILADFKGHYALPLLKDCDGLPEYSNGELGVVVDHTSFRGSVLQDCYAFLGKAMLEKAWTKVMPPTEAREYGASLLQLAELQEANMPKHRPGFFSRLFGAPPRLSFAEQRTILGSAGRWYVFWGQRGHHIEARY